MPKLCILNGPNLNLLGKRDTSHYGASALEAILTECEARCAKHGWEFEAFQSNHEGTLLDFLHEHCGSCDGLIVNLGAYTHTSIALRDALEVWEVPVIEVHLSNVAARESFRHKSLIADVVTGTISGFREWSYYSAVEILLGMHRG